MVQLLGVEFMALVSFIPPVLRGPFTSPSRNALPNFSHMTFPPVTFLIFPEPSSSSNHLIQVVTPLVVSTVSSFLGLETHFMKI